MKPTISVIIPCYNQGIFIQETIDSVLKQTFQDFEVIIVNDGSTDKGTISILKKIQNSRITVLHTANQGLSKARNNGLWVANGRFVIFLDSDDLIEKTYFQKAAEILEKKPQVGFVTPWIKAFGIASWILERPKFELTRELTENIVCVAALIRKKCVIEVGGYDEKMRGGYEDWDLWIRIGANGWEGEVIPEPLFLYRQRADSMVRTSNKTDNRKKLIAQLIENNSELYRKYFKEVIIGKDVLYMQKCVDEARVMEERDVLAESVRCKVQLIRQKDQIVRQREKELYEIRTSLRWKIPNYFYKLYKKRIKKFVPRAVFRIKDDIVVVFFKFILIIKKINYKKIKNSIIQDDPIITIGIASYNHSKYLKQCIESALSQDYQKYNIIIVDDNSSDPEQKEILSSYESNEKIKIIYKTENGGISASLNDQVINASGDWIAFLDCDDYLAQNALSRMAKYIKSYPKKRLVFSNRIEVDESGKILRKIWFGNRSYSKNIFRELMRGMTSSHLKLIHKDAFLKVGLFDDRFGGTHDYDMYLKVAFYMPEAFGYLDEYPYYHRIHSMQNTIIESEKHKENVKKMQDEFRFRERVYDGNFDKLVSVIILSFNRGERTRKTIERLLMHAKNIKKEIIIWDNGSTDQKTLEILRELQKNSEVTVYFSRENLHCSGGRKAGAKIAKGDLLYFLDNDIEIEGGALEELIIRLHEDNNIAGACSKVIFPNERIQFNGGQYFTDAPFVNFSLIDTGKNRTDISAMKKIECGWIPGGATMFRREIFGSIEHDTGYVNAFEDNDFSMQITEVLGMRVVNCPTSCVVHYHLNFEQFLDAGTKKYKEVRRDDNNAFITSWRRFYDKWGLIIRDDFILGINGLREKSQEEIKKYLDKAA